MNYLKDDVKEFWKNNKNKIITITKVSTGIMFVGSMTYLINDNRKKAKLLDCVSDIAIQYKIKYERVNELCKRKDAFMNGFMSKLLRDGNSDGARQMAYKRWS